jgi:DnaJ-class molecular chaperone
MWAVNHCVICEACHGAGYVHGAAFSWPCKECNGSGITSCCDAPREQPFFECPSCGAVSYNSNDIRERYCGRCHAWQL